MGNLPGLVFFNACESARVRTRGEQRERSQNIDERLQRTVGLAEAFLRGGVANYIGTYWPVGDSAAKRFSEEFYKRIMNGAPVGQSLQAGRAAVRALRSVDWADYNHYGERNFTLKQL